MPYRRAGFVALLIALLAASAAAQGGAVRGSVEDTEGHGIKGATIKATNPNGRPAALTATTDDKGRFALIGLVGGLWTFVAEAPGFNSQQGTARIRSTTIGNPPVEFVLSHAEVAPPGILAKQVQSDINEADQLRNSGRIDQAIAAYQAVAEKNPALTTVNIVLGDAYRMKAAKENATGDRQPLYDRAIAAYEQALRADPENDRARIELAMTQMQKGSLDDAERTLAPAAESPSASSETLLGLGEVKFAKGDMAGAEQLFQRASASDPSWMRPKLKLGLVAYRAGRRDAATELFKTVIAADANSREAAEASTYLKELAQ